VSMNFDQANNLRSLFDSRRRITPPKLNSRVITITSGKGGVGKTNFAANLAIYLKTIGVDVIVIDADFGLANIEILLGCSPRYSLIDVLKGNRRISEVISEAPCGVQFISGGNGLSELANISGQQLRHLMESLSVLDTMADVILVDTGAGISEAVINFVKASRETIIICNPEPTSVTDAYALVKTSHESVASAIELPRFKIVINRAEDNKEGEGIFRNLHRVAGSFLGMELDYLGCIPYDQNLVRAVKQQKPAILSFPDTNFSREITAIGAKLMDRPPPPAKNAGMFGFMKKLAGIFG